MLANTGVRGLVTFSNGIIAKYLTVKINSREPYFKTNELGEYYRILLPGNYNLSLMLNCTIIYTKTITVPSSGLLLFNITLSNDNYQAYQSGLNGLNRYGLYCTTGQGPISCSRNDILSSLTNSSSSSIWISYLTNIIQLIMIIIITIQ